MVLSIVCTILFPILQVFGNKDTDGFYRAEIRDRVGLIPCNMVSEIQTEDDDMMGQLLKQGFLPLNTPVEKLGEAHLEQKLWEAIQVFWPTIGHLGYRGNVLAVTMTGHWIVLYGGGSREQSSDRYAGLP